MSLSLNHTSCVQSINFTLTWCAVFYSFLWTFSIFAGEKKKSDHCIAISVFRWKRWTTAHLFEKRMNSPLVEEKDPYKYHLSHQRHKTWDAAPEKESERQKKVSVTRVNTRIKRKYETTLVGLTLANQWAHAFKCVCVWNILSINKVRQVWFWEISINVWILFFFSLWKLVKIGSQFSCSKSKLSLQCS